MVDSINSNASLAWKAKLHSSVADLTTQSASSMLGLLKESNGQLQKLILTEPSQNTGCI